MTTSYNNMRHMHVEEILVPGDEQVVVTTPCSFLLCGEELDNSHGYTESTCCLDNDNSNLGLSYEQQLQCLYDVDLSAWLEENQLCGLVVDTEVANALLPFTGRCLPGISSIVEEHDLPEHECPLSSMWLDEDKPLF